MKKYFLIMISFVLLLTSCLRAGGMKEIRATKLDTTPVLENKSTSISGFAITYYNVYKDENDSFVLADDTSYIIVEGRSLGIAYAKSEAEAYNYSSKEKLENIRPYESNELGYFSNFETIIIKPITGSTAVNIGIIKYWT